MKKYTLIVSFIFAFTLICISGYKTPVISHTNGAPAASTGSPADGQTCSKSNCHTGSVPVLPGVITSNVPLYGYVPGQTYTFTATLAQSGISRFGFQISPQSLTGVLQGTLIVTNPGTTKIVSTKYITQITAGSTSTTGSKAWSFNWVAPAAGTGDVTFYGAFNFANNNGMASGDMIKTSTLVVNEDLSVGIEDLIADGKSLIVYPNPIIDHFNIRYTLDHAQNVSITMYDLTGKQIENFFDGFSNENVNDHHFNIDASLQSGIYMLELKTETSTIVRKLVKI